MKRMRTGTGQATDVTCQNLGCYHAASGRLNRPRANIAGRLRSCPRAIIPANLEAFSALSATGSRPEQFARP